MHLRIKTGKLMNITSLSTKLYRKDSDIKYEVISGRYGTVDLGRK